MLIIKQSTAYTFQLGPFLDDTDGKTAETGLTIAYTDIYLSKAGGAFAAKAESTDLTGEGDARGWYDCVLGTGDTDTLGGLVVTAHISGALPVWQEFEVVPANVYDSLIAGTDNLDADLVDAPNATALVAAADALLDRDMSTGDDNGSPTVRTVRQALRILRNKWTVSAGTLTVTKEDDTTASWTASISSDAAAEPITGCDPASS